MIVGAPLPEPDRDSLPWWEAVREHRLTVQQCAECAALRWPARACCNRCGSWSWEWLEPSGRGTIASWIVSHHAFSGGDPSPYVVVSVRLDEQPDVVIPGAYAGAADGTDLRMGLPVEVGFEDVGGGEPAERATVLRWHPAGSGAGETQ